MKNFIAGVILLLAPMSLFALEGSGSLELKTENIYRGEVLPSNDIAVSGVFRLDDLFADGVYVETSIDTIDAVHPYDIPYDQLVCIQEKRNQLCSVSLSPRVYGAVGYVGSVWGLVVDTSVARMFNPVLHSDDYYEVSVELQTDRAFGGHFDVYGHISHALDDVDQWYGGVGLLGSDLLVEGLNARAGVNFYHYEKELTLSDWTRNNFEVSVEYGLFDTVDLFGSWSAGHRGVRGQELDNEYLLGVRFNF